LTLAHIVSEISTTSTAHMQPRVNPPSPPGSLPAETDRSAVCPQALCSRLEPPLGHAARGLGRSAGSGGTMSDGAQSFGPPGMSSAPDILQTWRPVWQARQATLDSECNIRIRAPSGILRPTHMTFCDRSRPQVKPLATPSRRCLKDASVSVGVHPDNSTTRRRTELVVGRAPLPATRSS